MWAVFAAWVVLGIVIGLIWLARLVAVGPVLRRQTPLTPESHPKAPGAGAKVSVLVAARNEENAIETCISGLLAQDWEPLEVIVIDDRSTDRTAEILQRLEQTAGGRLTALAVHELPEGWFGKPHAMHTAAQAATGEWLLLTDADCRQLSSRTVSIALAEAESHGADMLSITPMLETASVWEQVFQPAAALTLIFWFLPDRVNDPAKKTAYANGAFILVRKSCYNAIGGHEQVRASLNEDIHLARRAKQMGFKLRVNGNRGLYSTRMYETPRQAWRGWSRIFCGCLETVPRLALAAALVGMMSIVPLVSAAVGLAGWARSSADVAFAWQVASGIWCGAALFLHATLWRIYPVTGTGRWWALVYGLGAAGTLALLINAALKAAGITKVNWRGQAFDGRAGRTSDPARSRSPIKETSALAVGPVPAAEAEARF